MNQLTSELCTSRYLIFSEYRGKMKRRNFKETKELVVQLGYKLIEQSLENFKNKITIEDGKGFKYFVLFDNIYNKGIVPYIVSPTNPFSLDNISLWLKLNNKSFDLLSDNVYIDKDAKLEFYCHVCKETFMCSWTNMSQGKGCSICSGRKVGKTTSLQILRPDICKEWSDKNIISPNEVTVYSHKKVLWKCLSCKNEWEASIAHRTNMNSGCPNCASSKGEKKILMWLEFNKLNLIVQAKFDDCKNKKVLPFDFYLPDYNLCIEYQGEQHYEAKEFFGGEESLKARKKHDRIKKKYCKNKSINLLIIPYWEFDNIEQILSNTILELEGSN